MKQHNSRFSLIKAILILVAIGILSIVVYRAFAVKSDTTESSKKTPTSQINEEKIDPQGTVITTGDSEYGTMLFNDKKQAIYIWELEDSAKAECYGDCAEEWPPVLTNGAPRADGSVNEDLLGTTERTDGTTQVTYNGHPLYYYAHEKAGEVKCHKISTHGGLWWVIQPNGIHAD